jgi:hypothetical protein
MLPRAAEIPPDPDMAREEGNVPRLAGTAEPPEEKAIDRFEVRALAIAIWPPEE